MTAPARLTEPDLAQHPAISRAAWEAMHNGHTLDSLLESVIAAWETLTDKAHDQAFTVRIAHKAIIGSLGGPLGDWTRADYTDKAELSEHSRLLHMLLDGKDVMPPIIAALKPKEEA